MAGLLKVLIKLASAIPIGQWPKLWCPLPILLLYKGITNFLETVVLILLLICAAAMPPRAKQG